MKNNRKYINFHFFFNKVPETASTYQILAKSVKVCMYYRLISFNNENQTIRTIEKS